MWFLWGRVLCKPYARARPTGNASDPAEDEEEAVAGADKDGELTCAASEGDLTEQILQQFLRSTLKEYLARIDFDFDV